jgi:predicted Zn-dependent protease
MSVPATETLRVKVRQLDILPDGRRTDVTRVDRLTRFHSTDETIEESVTADGRSTRRPIEPLGLPERVQAVAAGPRTEFPVAEFEERVSTAGTAITAEVRRRLGERLAEVRLQARLERRTSVYTNDAGSDVTQSWDWSVLGVQLLLTDGATPRWALTIHEDVLATDPRRLVDRSAAEAEAMATHLAAGHPPAGEYLLQLEPDAAAVFWHEAVGHALEADFDQPNGLHVGARVAPSGWRIDDDPTDGDGQGSYGVDDEGIPSRRKALIADGRVTTVLTDRRSAARVGASITGNGRFGTGQIRPRMSNLDARGPGAGDTDLHRPRLVLSRPVAGGYDGRTFVLRCWSARVDSGDARRPAGAVTVTGPPLAFLSALRGEFGPPQRQRAGGLCHKGGSNGILVGVRTPGLLFAPVRVDDAGQIRLANP